MEWELLSLMNVPFFFFLFSFYSFINVMLIFSTKWPWLAVGDFQVVIVLICSYNSMSVFN